MIRIISILLIFISLQSWAYEIDYELIKEKGIYLKCDGFREVVFHGNYSDDEILFKKLYACSSETCRSPVIKFLIYMPEEVKPILDSNNLKLLGWDDDEKWEIENNFISYYYYDNGRQEDISLNLIAGEFKQYKNIKRYNIIESLSTICEQIPNKLKFSTSKLFGLIQ